MDRRLIIAAVVILSLLVALYVINNRAGSKDIKSIHKAAWSGIDVEKLATLSANPKGVALIQDYLVKSSEQNKAVLTVFQRKGDSYVRIATTVPMENGKPAIGTKLDPSSPAFLSLQQKGLYEGTSELFGLKYSDIYRSVINGEFVIFTGVRI